MKILKAIPILILFIGLLYFNVKSENLSGSGAITLVGLNANAQTGGWETCSQSCDKDADAMYERVYDRANDYMGSCFWDAMYANWTSYIPFVSGNPVADLANWLYSSFDLVGNVLPEAYECLDNAQMVMDNELDICVGLYFDCTMGCIY